jgi:hypothetical protein
MDASDRGTVVARGVLMAFFAPRKSTPLIILRGSRNLTRAFMAITAFAGATALSGCDPGYGIQGTVVHPSPDATGHVLFVTVVREGTLDASGFPVPHEGYSASLSLAKRVDSDESTFDWGTLGCDHEVRIAAWIDMNDSEGFEEKLAAGQSLTDADVQTDLHDEAAAAHPDAGDLVAVSVSFAFDLGHGFACDPGGARIVLEPE